MATTFKPLYRANGAKTITLASLATDANLLTGEQSDEFDNTANLDADILLSGKITTGTSPAANKEIDLWIFAWDAQAAAYPDVITGAGTAGKTLTAAEVRNAGGKLLKSILVNATSNVTYYFSNESVAALFGGRLPNKFVVFVVQNTGAALHATAGNHALDWQGVQDQGV
jgi:hypothetical protein